jgi:SAM-dependent methyltransferase
MMAQATRSVTRSHAPGHDEAGLECLIEQGRFYGDLTTHLFQVAGLRPGMRVLDIGCGAGDVAFLAARIVGPRGAVLGVDAAPEAIELATQRAASAGLTNVHFITGNVTDLVLDQSFDALVGRFILMYLSDPAVVLRRLAAYLRPGGIVAFHEYDLLGATSEPHCSTFELALARIRETFTRTGADPRAGLRMRRSFHEAGLPSPEMSLAARVEGGTDATIYAQVAGVAGSLLPLMERTGVATAPAIEIDTLAERMRAEALALDATIVSPVLVGAWARIDSVAVAV